MNHSPGAGWICSGVAVLALVVPANALSADIKVGMTSAEVMKQLGNPDGIKALQGKVLRDVADLEEIENSDVRTVFIYDREKVRVWFQRGKVTETRPLSESAPPETAVAADN